MVQVSRWLKKWVPRKSWKMTFGDEPLVDSGKMSVNQCWSKKKHSQKYHAQQVRFMEFGQKILWLSPFWKGFPTKKTCLVWIHLIRLRRSRDWETSGSPSCIYTFEKTRPEMPGKWAMNDVFPTINGDFLTRNITLPLSLKENPLWRKDLGRVRSCGLKLLLSVSPLVYQALGDNLL